MALSGASQPHRCGWISSASWNLDDADTGQDAEAFKILDHAKTAWPVWWGSSDHAKSPFDFVPAPLEGGQRRILFLTGMSSLTAPPDLGVLLARLVGAKLIDQTTKTTWNA